MQIITNKNYEINNLITQSGKFSIAEFQKELINMVNTYKDISIDNGDTIITTTKSIELNGEVQIMDLEILLPVSYRITMEEPYIFKNKIKLSNALYSKVDDVTMLQASLNQVNQYIMDNNLQPITSAYLVQTKQDNQLCIEIYVGINPNIL